MMTQKHITIGVAGHVDHGKTRLVKALTGIDTDRLQEEKRRGLSIESGIAPMELSSGTSVAFVDAPGHTDFMKNTIRGLSSVDAAILVVAADDGIMPQTREHLEILRFLRAETGFVVLSKADLVDEETLELAELEVRELLEGTFLQEKPLVIFSAADRRGVDEIRRQVEVLQEVCKGKSDQIAFRLWIDQVKGVQGFGTVVSGTVFPSHYLNVEIQVLAGARKPLEDGQKVKIYLGTSVTNARIALMGKDKLEAGQSGVAQLRLAKLVPALPSDPFVICLMDVPTVIGGGKVLEARSQKYRAARAATILPYLKALRECNLRDALSRFFENNPNRAATAEEIAGVTGFSLKHLYGETHRMLAQKELLLLREDRLIGRASYEAMKSRLLEAIRTVLKENALKEAVNLEEARSQARLSADQKLVQEVLDDLCRSGSLTKAGGGYQAPNVTGNLSREQETLITLLLDFASKFGLNPFSADTIWKLHDKGIEKKVIQKHLDYLKGQGKLAILGDKRFLSVEAVEEIKRRVGQVIQRKGAFTIPDCKEVLGYGRTVAVPVLEYLDTIGFTRRQGDERVFMKNNQQGGNNDE